MDFTIFSKAVKKQIDSMIELDKVILQAEVSKDVLWDTYLSSFPEGSNPIYLTNTEHDCNCCKSFIRQMGGMIVFNKDKLQTIWDIIVPEPAYQVVANAMSKYVREAGIRGVYLSTEIQHGAEVTRSEDKGIFNHFHYTLPHSLVSDNKGSVVGERNTQKHGLERSILEITDEAVGTVADLIKSKSIYLGDQYAQVIRDFRKVRNNYSNTSSKENFLWETAARLGRNGFYRNGPIGELMKNLSAGMELETAVGKYEAMVAPTNYKRSKALITDTMIKRAYQKFEELGMQESLQRRHAVEEDLTINNVLFADRSAKKNMGAFDLLSPEKPISAPKGDVLEVGIEEFIAEVLPKVDNIEMLVEGRHQGNLVNLVAPVNPEAPTLTAWDNNFTWSYNGDVTDSFTKELVKKHGGAVDGVLRFSIRWNDNNDNKNDLDAHCLEPDGHLIHYPNARRRSAMSGMLDVDIMSPGNKPAVENIIYSDIDKMEDGDYQFLVHNFSGRNGRNWSAEIEVDGTIYEYSHVGTMQSSQKKVVAVVNKKGNTFTVKHKMQSSAAAKDIWGITTNSYQKVRLVMLSPNHWDNNSFGNKHYMFMLDKCANPEPVRGFYNEFLKEEVRDHRKVLEVLASKMKAEPVDTQISGLGFSSTIRNDITVKVTGEITRVYKVKF